jgi:hypothetical protein
MRLPQHGGEGKNTFAGSAKQSRRIAQINEVGSGVLKWGCGVTKWGVA